jgi:signal transduction histidine kinase
MIMKPLQYVRNLSIGHKLTLLLLAPCLVILLLSGAALLAFQIKMFRNNFARDLNAVANIVGANSTAAVTFNDAKAATEILNSLRAKEHIVSAILILPDGTIFARYGHHSDTPVIETRNIFVFREADALMIQPVMLEGKQVATLNVVSDYRAVYAGLLKLVGWMLLIVVGVGVGVAALLSNWLQRFISDPVLRLARTAQTVADKNDYSVRAQEESSVELGILTRTFNQMLARIQSQDGALQNAQKQLAGQVEELKERARLASLDAEVGLALTRNDSLEEILQKCTQAVVDSLEAAFARIWTLNQAELVLELQASAGIYTNCNGDHQRVPVGQSKIGQIATRREAWMTNTVVGDARTPDQAWAKQEKMVSFAGFPLMVGNEVVGVLAMFSRQPITETAFQSLGSVANAIALGVARKRTEVALLESGERFRSLFENVRIGLYRCTADGRVLMGNPTFFRMLGCDAPELMYAKLRGGLSANLLKTLDNGTSEDLATINLDEVSDGVSANGRPFKNLLEEEGEVVGLERCWKQIDGNVIHVCESARAIRNAEGGLVYYEGTVEDITERKKAEAELEKMHKELLEVSRQAGMAEVATGVLHNVGNVLNSVSVSATLVGDRLRQSKVTNLCRATAMLRNQNGHLVDFLTSDPKGKLLPEYLGTVSDQLAGEQTEMLTEVALLSQNIEHIKEIVAMQQSYAKVSGALEHLDSTELLEDALRMNAAAFDRHRVQVIREYDANLPRVNVDRHKVLQILINLIRNAKYAMDAGNPNDKRFVARIELGADGMVAIRLRDNGVGISPENIVKIFGHGFTTKKDGHGFGLHSGANAAKEMGGRLSARSDGLGRGAEFTLELPVTKQKKASLS